MSDESDTLPAAAWNSDHPYGRPWTVRSYRRAARDSGPSYFHCGKKRTRGVAP